MTSTACFCDEFCGYVSPEESGRERFPKNKSLHICLKYGKPVSHGTYYPKLVRLPECSYVCQKTEKEVVS